jgi:hypothetical protein
MCLCILDMFYIQYRHVTKGIYGINKYTNMNRHTPIHGTDDTISLSFLLFCVLVQALCYDSYKMKGEIAIFISQCLMFPMFLQTKCFGIQCWQLHTSLKQWLSCTPMKCFTILNVLHEISEVLLEI